MMVKEGSEKTSNSNCENEIVYDGLNLTKFGTNTFIILTIFYSFKLFIS